VPDAPNTRAVGDKAKTATIDGELALGAKSKGEVQVGSLIRHHELNGGLVDP
jgi:hypothetical protein